jgi:hypothetical protein
VVPHSSNDSAQLWRDSQNRWCIRQRPPADGVYLHQMTVTANNNSVGSEVELRLQLDGTNCRSVPKNAAR